MLHSHLACLVSRSHEERDMIHIRLLRLTIASVIHSYSAYFASLSLKKRDILHTLFIKISGDWTKNFGRHDSSFGRDDFP